MCCKCLKYVREGERGSERRVSVFVSTGSVERETLKGCTVPCTYY